VTATGRFPRRELTVFLCLTFGLSAVFWMIIIGAGSPYSPRRGYMLALLWSPGLSALLTRLAFQRNVRGEGWGWHRDTPGWGALAYIVPIAYASVAFGFVLLTRPDGVGLERSAHAGALVVIVAFAKQLVSVTGEEIGWRGFLVPMLARARTFVRTALVSGAIWAAWHLPLNVFAAYRTPIASWYSVAFSSVILAAVAMPLAWLRLRSRSLWPAVIFHTSHNFFVQAFFARLTTASDSTRSLTRSFGAALAVLTVVTALIFWRMRGSIDGKSPS